MAREGQMLQDGNIKTATDLSAKQFFAVKLTNAGDTVALVAAQTDDVYGILQNKPTANLVCDVCTEGLCKASAGTSITAGAALMANTSGQLITFVAGSGNCLVGWAVTGAGGANAIFTMRVHIQKVIT